jgi:hypothetical protein
MESGYFFAFAMRMAQSIAFTRLSGSAAPFLQAIGGLPAA